MQNYTPLHAYTALHIIVISHIGVTVTFLYKQSQSLHSLFLYNKPTLIAKSATCACSNSIANIVSLYILYTNLTFVCVCVRAERSPEAI